MQEERERGLALVGFEDLHEAGAELRRQPVGVQDDVEAGQQAVVEVAQQGDLLDLEAVRRLLALRPLLGLDEIARRDLALDEDLRVLLHEGQPGLVVLAEQGELVGPVEILHQHARARRAGARGEGLDIRDDARHRRLARLVGALTRVDALLELGQAAVREGLDLETVAVQRVRRQVHAHVFLLLLEQREHVLLAGEGRDFRPHGFELLHLAEERIGGVQLVIAVESRVFDGLVDEQLSVLAGQEELRTLVAE